MVGSSPLKANSEIHLHVGKAHELSIELSNWEFVPCVWLQQGVGENMSPIDDSLHLYLN